MTPRDEIRSLLATGCEHVARSRHGDPAVDAVLASSSSVPIGGLPLTDGNASLAFGKFWASPGGEPTDDPRCRMFESETEAAAYAYALVRTIPDDEVRASCAFVAVGQFRDDEEAVDAAVEDAREHAVVWPIWTPYGWATEDGYVSGSYEDSEELWG